eukprot:gnl/TRDRNA2_/TRDRNA2_75721_c0_seq1.p1 gnl/TRDRNA2_/TRDRNA2_75721_c0~~gnl/TRDRNA2_/TRDRNA2_75721_c0_seq1.p1  ORF type:complete len:524 (+),score=88.95 gnl/TRDRNA2_/TRDRNA2_75721_c0_seq1:208-1572(+)
MTPVAAVPTIATTTAEKDRPAADVSGSAGSLPRPSTSGKVVGEVRSSGNSVSVSAAAEPARDRSMSTDAHISARRVPNPFVNDIVTRCICKLGRPAEETAFVTRALEEHGFVTREALLQLDERMMRELGIPMRFLRALLEELRGGESPNAGAGSACDRNGDDTRRERTSSEASKPGSLCGSLSATHLAGGLRPGSTLADSIASTTATPSSTAAAAAAAVAAATTAVAAVAAGHHQASYPPCAHEKVFPGGNERPKAPPDDGQPEVIVNSHDMCGGRGSNADKAIVSDMFAPAARVVMTKEEKASAAEERHLQRQLRAREAKQQDKTIRISNTRLEQWDDPWLQTSHAVRCRRMVIPQAREERRSAQPTEKPLSDLADAPRALSPRQPRSPRDSSPPAVRGSRRLAGHVLSRHCRSRPNAGGADMGSADTSGVVQAWPSTENVDASNSMPVGQVC